MKVAADSKLDAPVQFEGPGPSSAVIAAPELPKPQPTIGSWVSGKKVFKDVFELRDELVREAFNESATGGGISN